MMDNNQFNKVRVEDLLDQDTEHLYWIKLIQDLVEGAGYSYSRIAYRMGVSPSTIHKLATIPGRKPQSRILTKLVELYNKVFYGPFPSSQVKAYLESKQIFPQDELNH